MSKYLALLLLAYPFGIPAASAYSLGNCSYESANGTEIVSLSCPDAPSPVSVHSGSSLPNADPSLLSGTYVPAAYHVDGVWYVSLPFVLTVVVWFFGVFMACVSFYHASVVAFKIWFGFWKKRPNPS